ncbi:uncharacterized protein B0I36DRAFT_37185 [Microdochium trichocladiopsis]|uniref:Uncharacterized protein n=1 Tax=Microdochium trichocladiopsis TaxID=1682393 RepID=A0A9P8XUR3_9PEZI|nr:uncharacterized protein B0I36DRAFT_37185 [Microdochium trichocladiopsis]KAH7018265.1 hypothetical protein B0I36DRAFT_37185 [Microdochium trichocladiopsis]
MTLIIYGGIQGRVETISDVYRCPQADSWLPNHSGTCLNHSDCGLVALAGWLGDRVLGLLLTIFAAKSLLGLLLTSAVLLGLRVGSLNVGVGRGNTGLSSLVLDDLNLVASSVKNASPGLILGVELDLSCEGLDLLLIKQVAILVAVLYTLFALDDLLILDLKLGRAGYDFLGRRLLGLRSHRLSSGNRLGRCSQDELVIV